MSISTESENINTDIGSIIFKSSAPPILIGGEGNILPCIELCNINFNFKQQNKLIITNQNGKLYIPPDVGNTLKSTMFPCYSSINICSESTTPSDKLYTLVDIVITCPSLHREYQNNTSTILDGEIYMVFKNDTHSNTTYKVLAILLEETSNLSTSTPEAYKLFESIASNLPANDSQKTITTIADWDLNDLLPKNKWFYNYVHPNNPLVNWYVYKNHIYIPPSFKSNYILTVSRIINNGTITTGTDAYNKLYSTIQTLQNPAPNTNLDKSFIIFEQRDLSPEDSIRTSSYTTYIESEDEISNPPLKKTVLNEEPIAEEEEENSTSIIENNENHIWNIIIMFLNICFFIILCALIIIFLFKKGYVETIINGSYNIIFYLIIMIIFNLMYNIIYLIFNNNNSTLAKMNISFIIINWIIYIGLIIIIVIKFIKINKHSSSYIPDKTIIQHALELSDTPVNRATHASRISKNLLTTALGLSAATSAPPASRISKKMLKRALNLH